MRVTVVDAFTSEPFAGNPAAVVVTESPLEGTLMQQVASEMNHAETAFVTGSGSRRGLRWFTPTVEVDLCGHATLAAAHVLQLDRVTFDTRSGDLTAERDGDGWALDFPRVDTAPAELPDVGVAGRGFSAGADWLIEVVDEAAVRAATPDLRRLAGLPVRGLIVTAVGDVADVVSRGFFPAVGIDEDHVTGSAHCAIGPHFAPRLGDTLRCRQLGRREGEVKVTVLDGRVRLGGRCVTTLTGELHHVTDDATT